LLHGGAAIVDTCMKVKLLQSAVLLAIIHKPILNFFQKIGKEECLS